MAKPKKQEELGPMLETAVIGMLNKVNSDDIDMELRLKVFDRAAKYWQIKMKVADASLGAGFRDDDDKENE